eukprot:TRINITY_DN5111_c1_g1_i1.p1 TRINITY_DN5111_c1_g1~~TRINITY_DN5111_c1_g1_i1.p1  ORF type:complete len:732 (+),score=208.43 TRINITY_DN5111_c1_g1_i1:84-2279(+)
MRSGLWAAVGAAVFALAALSARMLSGRADTFQRRLDALALRAERVWERLPRPTEGAAGKAAAAGPARGQEAGPATTDLARALLPSRSGAAGRAEWCSAAGRGNTSCRAAECSAEGAEALAEALAREAAGRIGPGPAAEPPVYLDLGATAGRGSPAELLDACLGWRGLCATRDAHSAAALRSTRSCRVLALCPPAGRPGPPQPPEARCSPPPPGAGEPPCVTPAGVAALAAAVGAVLAAVGPLEEEGPALGALSAAGRQLRFLLLRRPSAAALGQLGAAGWRPARSAPHPAGPLLMERPQSPPPPPPRSPRRLLVLADVAEGMGAATSAVAYMARVAAAARRSFLEPHISEHVFRDGDFKADLPAVRQTEYRLTAHSLPATDYVRWDPPLQGLWPSPGLVARSCGGPAGAAVVGGGPSSGGPGRLPLPLMRQVAQCAEALAARALGPSASLRHVIVQHGQGGSTADYGYFNIACPSQAELGARWPVSCPMRDMSLPHTNYSRVARELGLLGPQEGAIVYNVWARKRCRGRGTGCEGLYVLPGWEPADAVKVTYTPGQRVAQLAAGFLAGAGVAGSYAVLHVRYAHLFKFGLSAEEVRRCSALLFAAVGNATSGLPLLVLTDSPERLALAPPAALRAVRGHSADIRCYVSRSAARPLVPWTTMTEVALAQHRRCSLFLSISWREAQGTPLAACVREGGRYGSTFAHNICRAKQRGSCKGVLSAARERAAGAPS